MTRDDTLWKSILEDMIVYFLRFFYQETDQLFDLTKKIKFDSTIDSITDKHKTMGIVEVIRERQIKALREEYLGKGIEHFRCYSPKFESADGKQ